MTWNVAGTAWVTILEPSSSDVRVLLVDDMLNILALLHDLICHHDTTDTGANGEHLDSSCMRGTKDDVWNDIVAVLSVWPIAICDLVW